LHFACNSFAIFIINKGFWDHLGIETNRIETGLKTTAKVKCKKRYIRCQFHQHFTGVFFIPKCFAQIFPSCSGFGESTKALSYQKRVHKMLMELTTGVNFTNVLRTAFALVDPKSVKNTVKSSVTFYAFGIYECKSCT